MMTFYKIVIQQRLVDILRTINLYISHRIDCYNMIGYCLIINIFETNNVIFFKNYCSNEFMQKGDWSLDKIFEKEISKSD